MLLTIRNVTRYDSIDEALSAKVYKKVSCQPNITAIKGGSFHFIPTNQKNINESQTFS
ncbi:protein of unknown function [Xenorhabdus poinarii G6]|uniref:Uncharacterized protein n=1 Tax=Xenorhabdus poinarii G6 TaxID=1354304 RepID=A0A068R5A3_9GAMM|nr:protein of unknown function [Xenorhabdus poinarii G6]